MHTKEIWEKYEANWRKFWRDIEEISKKLWEIPKEIRNFEEIFWTFDRIFASWFHMSLVSCNGCVLWPPLGTISSY